MPIDTPNNTRATDRPAQPPWRVEGAPPSPSDGSGPSPSNRRPAWLRFGWMLLLLLGLNWVVSSVLLAPPARTPVSYTFFLTQVKAVNVAEITSTGDTIEGAFTKKASYTPTGEKQAQQVDRFTTQRPSFADDNLFAMLQSNGVPVNANPPDAPPPLWQQILVGFGPTLLLVGLLFWVSRRMASGAGGLGGFGGFGRSRAKLYEPESGPRTTFADVAGIEEVEQEVTEIVDFLREPEKYRRLGAQVPHGVLLSGPPGTGKTLLARAVAGEAKVPFFSISASEFIEMIVGVGASRVRDLFDQAKKVAPSIVFIDELDAIGRARGGGQSLGGNDEREQTLNQILTEMDGFNGSEGVVVLAATNRAEILDAALLRPGRFDRRVTVSPPDLVGRRKILEVHTRGVPVAPGVGLEDLAAATPGMVGADLKNLVNEAALLAARRGHDVVQNNDFTDALEKIVLGTVRGIMLTPEEKARTAYHESGHALLGMLTPGADPVRKISIIPRGQALGVTFQSPATDRYGYSAQYLRGRIIGALGGRAAEEVVYGDMTTGAESDLDQVSNIARQMVGRWGMSEAIGPVTVLPPPGQESPLGLDGVAPATKELVDSEVRKIVEDCYAEAVRLLGEHREQLNRLAHRLLETETLDEDDAYAAAGIDRETAPGAVARGETGGAPAPGLPPEQAAASGIEDPAATPSGM
ncbi:ATP-dependent zinc metalloprotease FtsH [Planotetraspora thailandica]|uniref:ATP-dependent zinc metalloprotease FtsH n=1 Tax=Planotetraspora thailandica TaxID=487172 RepID=A0A8J3UY76_9ACTN|nr:ATP-dependent zinc metalloprotease FtsH [Planotetraspora thailandica]GII54234.1 ATP-dependent zinc metalloprotease FtsH [Planotetraspora thailandica]